MRFSKKKITDKIREIHYAKLFYWLFEKKNIDFNVLVIPVLTSIWICANPNKRNFDENSILLILNKDRAASFIHFG